jgi:glyoxylase-like metal-dependent hydrolase (beta-lactamase superfamily II)
MADMAVTVRTQQVGPHAYYVEGVPGMASPDNEGFNSNAGFVVTDEGVVVVDALGTYRLGRALRSAIARVTPRPIRRVVVTHYHADHFYGLGAFVELGAEIWAHERGREYLQNDAAARLAQRRRDLGPELTEKTELVPPDRWLAGGERFALGGLDFELTYVGPAHSTGDVVLAVGPDGVLFAGDIAFAGRVPYVGGGDSRGWLQAIDRLLPLRPQVMVPGHGPASRDPGAHLAFTREYLVHLRATMGQAVQDMVPFEEAYARADWSRFRHLPAFEPANRINAYGTYVLMERESLGK